jgi:hypothetical protein
MVELLKTDSRPLEFQFEDVTFLVKPHATVRDHLELIDTFGVDGKGMITTQSSKLYRFLIRQFVMDWRGVTQNGKSVPYSYETFENDFPIDAKGSLCALLGAFIMQNTGLLPKADEGKNGSSGPSSGS